MIYTSYFRKAMHHPDAVAITHSIPKGFRGPRFMELAPPKHLFGLNDPELFRRRYREEVLLKLNPQATAAKSEGRILLCYEGPGKFCHRQVVAEWLREEAGVEVEEWAGDEAEDGKPAEGPEQLTLF